MFDERIKTIEIAMEDDEFVEKVANIESITALKELFATKDVIMSDEEVEVLYKIIKKMLESDNGELSDEFLDDVSGGWVGGAIFVGGCYIAGRVWTAYYKKKLGIC